MAEFRVTAERDGSRSFNDHDDRWSRGGGGGRGQDQDDRWSRGGGGGGPGKYRGGYSNRRNNYRGGRKSYSNNYNSRGYGNSSNYRGGGGGGGSNSYRGGRGGRGGGYVDYDKPGSGPDPRSRLDGEGDDTMGDESGGNQRRFTPYGRPSRRSRGNYRGKRNDYNSNDGGRDTLKRFGLPIDSRDRHETQWYRVTIPWGKKAEKDFILKNLNSNMDTPFQPTHFHYQDNNAVFYINDRHASDALKTVAGRITMPNGYKMKILVKPSGPPNLPMGEEEMDKLKVCMSNRYDPATKTLNLSSFHTDQELKAQNLYMALSRAQVLCNVVKIIQQHIPELVSLDLSHNRLIGLEHLAVLVDKTPDVVSVNLGHNRMNYFDELRKIGGWKLTCLVLDGNTICDKFNDQASYVSAVRKIFPKVLKLDGHDLPPPITFDIEARTDLPKAKDSFFPNMEAQTAIVKFLKDYISVYDSDNRSGLAGAYHDSALFSLSTAYNSAVQYRQVSLSVYIEESRNLIRTNNKDTGRKQKLLKQGNHIVPQLCLLPKTVHDPNSFIVDVDFVSPQLMSFTVQGVFKEVETKHDKPPIRAFSRTFATVPGGVSMLIVNDMLTITNASPDQMESAFKNPAPTPSSSPVPQTAPTTNPLDGVGMSDVQQKMIVSFMAESGMNSEWSSKCLAENGWDYAKAGQNFLTLQTQGKIPPAAFNK